MHLITLPLLVSLLALAFAAPAPASNNNDNIVSQDHILYLPTTNPDSNNALHIRQEKRCDWDAYCLPAYQKCVKSCKSLFNSDW
jgi:hypothetical protein